MSRGKILIVEDEFVVAENLRAELESMSFEIVGLAFSGNEALALARQDTPDLVLMDIKLGEGIDGIETAIHLRQELDVPTFFLTAFSDESFLERAKIAEPLGYMVKPFERNGLRAGIEMAHYKARMEHLLKESESRFRSMFENSPVAYLALDECNRFLDLNSEFCELIGYNRDELISSNFNQLIHIDRQNLYLAQFAKLKDYGRLETELDLVRKDQTLLTVVLHGHVQSSIDGKSLRTHCILHNITERKRIEEERRQSEQTLWKQNEFQQTLLSAIPAYVYIKDNNSVYLIGNKNFSELSGIPENEISGKTDYDFFSEADADCFRKNDAEIFASGEPRLNYEMKGTDAEGNIIWFSTSKAPFYSYSGEIAGLVGICIDITERKRMEQALRKSEERLSSAAKAASFGVYSYDFDSHRMYCSPEFLTLHGVAADTPQDLDGDLFVKALHPDDKLDYLARMKAANDPCGSGILEHEYRIIRPDGQERWMRVIGQTVFSGNHPKDRPLHANGVIHDITQRKLAEVALNKAYDELEQRVFERTTELEKSNHTLSMMLDYARKAEIDIKERVVANLRTNSLFLISALKKEQLPIGARDLVRILETTTQSLAHPLARNLESHLLKLTPREIQLANLIRLGKSTKDLVVLLNLSAKTIESHRNNLRKKLGLRHQKTNLRTFLNSEFIG